MADDHGGNPDPGSHRHVSAWVKIFGTGGIAGLIVALVSVFTFLNATHAWPFGRGSTGSAPASNAPATPVALTGVPARPSATAGPSATPASSGPARFAATAGPSCTAGDATFDTTGAWTPLSGAVSGNCGALAHETTDSAQAANWYFEPGPDATCTFTISIPASPAISAYRATYQAWETRPGKHLDRYRIGTDASADQAAHLGGTITITYGPTATGLIDLQLYDDNADNTREVAGSVTALCVRPLPKDSARLGNLDPVSSLLPRVAGGSRRRPLSDAVNRFRFQSAGTPAGAARESRIRRPQ